MVICTLLGEATFRIVYLPFEKESTLKGKEEQTLSF